MSNPSKTPSATTIVSELVKSFDLSVIRGSLANVSSMLSGTKVYLSLLAFFWLLVYVSSIVSLDAINIGYHHAYAVTREIPWGILISTYIFFVVTSTGLCIVSSIGHVFGIKSFMPIAKRAVFLSIVTIVAGFVAILLEVESPHRMAIYNVLSPNLTSNIWWMGTLYGAYMFFMAVEFVLLQANQYKFAMYAGLAGLLSGIAAHSNLGAIFGMLHGREFWYGPYMPIYFIVSAMMSGCAAIILFSWLASRLKEGVMDDAMKKAFEVIGKLCTLLIGVLLFFTAWKIITGLVGGAGKKETLAAFLTGPYAVNFWVFELMMGMLIPFVLMLVSRGRNISMMVTASALMIVGIFFMRYDLVVLGQVVPVLHEIGVNEYPSLLSYMPSFHEIMIVIGTFGIAGLAFLLGEKVFDGHKSEVH
jgi:molybdopterin-containing oxidoreductase family membrane subunit